MHKYANTILIIFLLGSCSDKSNIVTTEYLNSCKSKREKSAPVEIVRKRQSETINITIENSGKCNSIYLFDTSYLISNSKFQDSSNGFQISKVVKQYSINPNEKTKIDLTRVPDGKYYVLLAIPENNLFPLVIKTKN